MTEFITLIATLSLMGCYALIAVGSAADDRMRAMYERELNKKEQNK